nr:MAG TPA: hypothetical protein [Caudoviricetes sp.]
MKIADTLHAVLQEAEVLCVTATKNTDTERIK